MSFSFEFNGYDMNEINLTVIGGDWPFVPIGDHETVNIPGKVGGYTYHNEFIPGEFTMDVIITGADAAAVVDNVNAFAYATPIDTVGKLYLDGLTTQYWKCRRISPVIAPPIGTQGVEFSITWQMDDPRPYDAATDLPVVLAWPTT